MAYAVVALMALLVGMIAGWALDRWSLRVRECPRCQEDAPIDEIRWRCACGEVTTEEEL